MNIDGANMSLFYLLFTLFWVFSSADVFEINDLYKFLGNLIDTWQLRPPTIIVKGDLPKLCMRRQENMAVWWQRGT